MSQVLYLILVMFVVAVGPAYLGMRNYQRGRSGIAVLFYCLMIGSMALIAFMVSVLRWF